MTKVAWIFHKSKMNHIQSDECASFLKRYRDEGLAEHIELEDKPSKKTIKKNDYPEWFEDLWRKLPIKTGKPETLKACEDALKRGYTALDIEKGIPGYAAEEKRLN